MQKHLFILITSISVLALILAPAANGVTPQYSVAPLTADQAAEYDLDTGFYSKVTEAEGILIATSSRVSDLAHLEAAYQFGMIMQRISPAIAERIREKKVLCILIGHDELTSQLPQCGIV